MDASNLCIGWIRISRRAHARSFCTLALGAMLALATGCASDGENASLKGRIVDVKAFSDSNAAPATTQSATSLPAVAATVPTTSPTAVASNAGSPPAPAPTDDNAAPSDHESGRPMAPGQEAVVESLIGQISGRPIFADAFLAPIDDQLRSESERLSPQEFMQSAQRIVGDRLKEVVINELFLAEAEASLSPPQKMGLLAYLKDLQEKNIAEAGGTLFNAQAKVASEQEMSLSQFEEAQKNSVLIGNLLYQRVQPRVIVSWRDVQREYELRKAEFNPPKSVTFQRLQLDDATQKELIDQVTTRFAAGEQFDSVVQALTLGEFVTVVGRGPMTMGPGGVSDIEVAADLKLALAKLKGEAGETTEAILRRGTTNWLHIEKIEQPPGKTIYEVQEQLIAALRARRENEERNKYIQSLLQKGIYDELDAMSKRVLAVVILRYSR